VAAGSGCSGSASFYRQLMYYVAIKSTLALAAWPCWLAGVHLERKATVTAQAEAGCHGSELPAGLPHNRLPPFRCPRSALTASHPVFRPPVIRRARDDARPDPGPDLSPAGRPQRPHSDRFRG